MVILGGTTSKIEFEQNLSTQSKNSFAYLKSILNNFNNQPAGQIKITRQIEIINNKIKNCNKTYATIFYNLASSIYEIIKDYKNQKPEIINNIKDIKGVQNKDFINRLASSYNDIAKYIKIIKTYVSVET